MSGDAETPEAEGTVPSQWWLDLKVKNQALVAEVERLQEALRGLDAPVQWIAEHYPAVWREMPTAFYRAFSEARTALSAGEDAQ